MTNSISLEDRLLIAKVKRKVKKCDAAETERLLTHFKNMLIYTDFNKLVEANIRINVGDLRVGFEKFVNSDENLFNIIAEILLRQNKDKA
jgi:hypothetical protein